jgi:hypothetical protein
MPTARAAPQPLGAVVARQLSVWPFAARTQRLFLLIDPSLPDPEIRSGLLRAMQQAYFRSDSCSQTRAVRDAAMAAHHVLRHVNRDNLSQDHICAAAVVAAIRGNLAYVALAGDAAALAWREGVLSGEQGKDRLPRPLGLEQEPRVSLWSTPVEPGDRMVLVCGARWTADSERAIQDILTSSPAPADAEERLGQVLSGGRPAGVMVADPVRRSDPARRLVLVSSTEHGRSMPEAASGDARRHPAPPAAATPSRRRRSRVLPLLGVIALAAAAVLLALNPRVEAPRTREAAAMPDDVARVFVVSPSMAVRLGPSGGNVIDLAVGHDALYTLDVVEHSVRKFALDGRDQPPNPDTLLTRAGAPIAASPRRLGTPIAIQYVGAAAPDSAADGLMIVDDARTVVQVSHGRDLNARPLQSSTGWRELGALGAGAGGRLYLLDSGARQLLEYGTQNQRIADPPRPILDAASAPGLAFERVVQVLGVHDRIFARMEDGALRAFDAAGRELAFEVRPSDGRPISIVSMAPDRAGGLYLGDSANARVLHTTADGSLMRQLRDPALAGVRQIHSSLDGRQMFGLVASGVLVFDLPSEVPEPVRPEA